jgi:hypothetical protein
MTAAEFARSRENVVVLWISQGCPRGTPVALLPGYHLPFDLSGVEGEVRGDTFHACNLKDGEGAWDFRFHDHSGNLIYSIQIYEDERTFARQRAESESL